MSIGSRTKAFAGTLPGYVVFLALIILVVAASLVYLGTIFGAITLLIFAFGIPVYLGWGRSLRHFLLIALVVSLLIPPISSVLLTNELVTPSPAYVSPDNALQNAVVSPFQATSSAFNFSVEVNHTHLPRNYSLTEVFLWVTNCPSDSNSTRGQCGSNDFFQNLSYAVSSPERNLTHSFPVSFVENLPKGQIFYFEFWTWGVNTTSNSAYSSSCTGPPGQGICGYAEGPVTGIYGTIYALVLVEVYLLMAEIGILLVVAILFYRFLKGREKRRNAMAKAQAEDQQAIATPVAKPLKSVTTKGGDASSGTKCPQCGATVEPGEAFCWKCGKDLPPPPRAQTGSP